MLFLGQSGFHVSVDSNPYGFAQIHSANIDWVTKKLAHLFFKSEKGQQLMVTSANRFSRVSHRFHASPSIFV